MKVYIEKKQFSEVNSMINAMFANIKGNHVSQFVKISASDGMIFFEYFNEKDYLKMKYETTVEEEGSAVISVGVLKIINSLTGTIKISQDDKKNVLHFSDSKKVLNAPPSDIDVDLQHPFGQQASFTINANQFSNEIKFAKTSTKEADTRQERFKNILVSVEGGAAKMVAATGHMLLLVKLNIDDCKGGQFYIPRSIMTALISMKKTFGKDEVIKVSNFESYHAQVETGNVLIHSSYETREFVDYSIWNNVKVSTAIQIHKKDLMECLNSLMLLKPYLDKVEFCVKDTFLKFYSAKNSEVDMKALIDISKAKNPTQYRGSFSGKDIRNFISRLGNDEDIVLGLDQSLQTNIIKTGDSKLICNTLTMKGV